MKTLDGRKRFVQWDKDLKLTSENLKVGDQVHFDNGTTPNALIVIAKEYEGKVAVDVPNIFLTNPFQIKVYRYVETEESSYTKETTLFDVEARKKPDDYVYTPTEVRSYEDLEKRVAKLEKGGNGGGAVGENGATFIPYVSEKGVISWTNDKGLENPESVDMVQAVLSALPDNREVAY